MAMNDNIRNFSDLSAEELMRLFENGVLLEYGGIAIKVEPIMLATAQHYIDDIPAEERHKVLASHDRVRFGTIGDAARDRSHGIERLAQRKSALGRNALTAWLETDQAT